MTVHLVRHGQSTWNVEGRLQGQTVHPELTERGRREAAEAAALLRARCPGTGEDVGLICSDLVRAAQTAAVIGQVLGVSVEQDVALREQGLGVLEGRLTKELVPEPTPEGLDITEVRWGGASRSRTSTIAWGPSSSASSRLLHLTLSWSRTVTPCGWLAPGCTVEVIATSTGTWCLTAS